MDMVIQNFVAHYQAALFAAGHDVEVKIFATNPWEVIICAGHLLRFALRWETMAGNGMLCTSNEESS